MEDKKNDFFKHALNYGVILGLILIIFQVIVYIFNIITLSLWAGTIIGAVNLILLIICISVFIKSYRNNVLGGFIKYGRALWFGTVIALSGAILVAIYSFVFNSYIDPDYLENTAKAMQQKTTEYMESMGVPQSEIDKAADRMGGQMQTSPLKGALWSIPGTAILGFIISLIAAAVLKKKKGALAMEAEAAETEENVNENSQTG